VQHYTWGNNPQCTSNCSPQWNEQATQDVNYYYDVPVGNDYTQNNTWGRLSAVVFHSQANNGNQVPSFAYEYSYNQAGRVTGNRLFMALGSNSLDLQGQYAWDDHGRMTSMTYPSGPVMTYQYDAMGRPANMNETSGIETWVAGSATYGSAGQLLTVGGGGITGSGIYNGTIVPIVSTFSEGRQYNNMLQLTHLTGSATNFTVVRSSWANVDLQYVYNVGHNNGRVSQTVDNVLNETVNYTYDYLHRLTTASNGSWAEQYGYDGFGNLNSKTPTAGSAPAFNGGGNATGGALSGQWDVENRPMTQTSTFFVYDPYGRRIYNISKCPQGDSSSTPRAKSTSTARRDRSWRATVASGLPTEASTRPCKASTPISPERCYRRRTYTSRRTAWAASAPIAMA
jgi:YD repeat-containing protein